MSSKKSLKVSFITSGTQKSRGFPVFNRPGVAGAVLQTPLGKFFVSLPEHLHHKILSEEEVWKK